MDRQKSSRKIFYGWFVFAVSFLMVFTALGFCSSTKGLYLAAITEDLGLARSLFSLNDSLRFITTAVVNLFFGAFILKLGPRKMIGIGFLSLISSMLVYSFAQTIYVFYLGGILLGFGLSWTTTSIVGFLVEKWFTNSKGTIMGIILAANGLGGATASQVLSPIIYGQTGWRTAYRVTAVILAAVAVLVVLVIREKPEDVGQMPLGTDKEKKERRGAKHEGITLSEARRRPYFYLSLIGIFFTGMVLQSTTGISSAHMRDVGFSPQFIANVLSIHSLALAAAKMFTGFSFDRFGLRKTMLICNGCAMAALLLLTHVSGNVSAISYGIVSSFALPLETVMLPLIALDLYGTKEFSRFMGLFVSFNTLGYALGTPLVNAFFDLTGSYKNILTALTFVMLAVAVLMQYVITLARREQAS